MTRLVDETYDQLANLKSLCESFFNRSEFTIYKCISVILRTMLRGSSGNDALIEQVVPKSRLFPLTITPTTDTPPEHLVLPADARIAGCVNIGQGSKVKNLNVEGGAIERTSVDQMFDSTKPPIPIEEWRQQPFLRPEWTLNNFIEVVAHKDGGAHVDPNNAQLLAMEAWGHFHWHLMAGIGLCVHPQLLSQLEVEYPQHTRILP